MAERALMTLAASDWSMHGDVGFGWWLLMAMTMIAFWAGVIALVVWLVRRGPGDRETPEEILERRLAEGQLDVEEYERRRSLLRAAR